jgi:hypothetical protein
MMMMMMMMGATVHMAQISMQVLRTVFSEQSHFLFCGCHLARPVLQYQTTFSEAV